jgi:hypothetical protein
LRFIASATLSANASQIACGTIMLWIAIEKNAVNLCGAREIGSQAVKRSLTQTQAELPP